ncbi:MAG: hypothetical protein Q9197_001709 [Variospora fuerteventurae]
MSINLLQDSGLSYHDLNGFGQKQMDCFHGKGTTTIHASIKTAWSIFLHKIFDMDAVSFSISRGKVDILNGTTYTATRSHRTSIENFCFEEGQTVRDVLATFDHRDQYPLNAKEELHLMPVRSAVSFWEGPSQNSTQSTLLDHVHSIINSIVVSAKNDCRSRENSSNNPYGCSLTLNVVYTASESRFWLHFRPEDWSIDQVKHLAAIFTKTGDYVLGGSDFQVSEIDLWNETSWEQIAQWNAGQPTNVNTCVHDLIIQRARDQPIAPALCAWDGELSYGELNQLSESLSFQLANLGIGPSMFVPIYLEKSIWMPVAMFSIMRAGGAFVMLDASHPIERLQEVCQQVDAHFVISIKQHLHIARKLAPFTVVLDDENAAWRSSSCQPDDQSTEASVQPRSKPDDYVYAVFTSGSTGKPKTVVVKHAAFSSSAKAHATPLRLCPSSRVFHFASYALDLSVSDHLTTLIAGACLCIPSEDDRSEPSLLALLKPDQVPTLQTLALIGEPMTETDVVMWSSKVHLIGAYGPAECSVISTVQPNVRRSDPLNIGFATGARCWVVSPTDYHRLLPVGLTGELLLEGPILAQGYLNAPEKTAAAFVDAPEWMGQFKASKPCRLYRTGDLVRYTPDGSLTYCGRRDAQTKIRGQRVELGEIEYRIRNLLPTALSLIVEVVTHSDTGDKTVVAFVQRDPGEASQPEREMPLLIPETEDFRLLAKDTKRLLRSSLTTYMIPKLFIEISKVPLTPSGKTNRRLLREAALTFVSRTQGPREQNFVGTKPPVTKNERKLCSAWAQMLGIKGEQISTDDNFFSLGGDSIGAMKMVARLRKEGFALSVISIFTLATLAELAISMQSISADPQDTIQPLSLVPANEDIIGLARDQWNIDPQLVEDALPCTPLQEGLVSLSAKVPSAYVSRFAYQLAPATEIARFKAAWEAVVDANAILRTRIIQTESGRMWQLVIAEGVTWEDRSVDHLWDHDLRDGSIPMLGNRLSRFKISKDANSGSDTFFLSLHHAIYDGWSLALLLKQVEQAYNGSDLSRRPFSPFIRYLQESSPVAARAFWHSYFQDLEVKGFPSLPEKYYTPRPSVSLHRSLQTKNSPAMRVPMSTAFKLALAILLAWYTDSDDVVFGAIVSGRNAAVNGIDEMTGPTIATVPVRVRLHSSATIDVSLRAVQEEAVAMIPFEQTGLQHIAQVGQDPRTACQFRTLLVVQPPEEESDSCSLFQGEISGEKNFNSYGLTVLCHPYSEQIELEVRIDPEMLSVAQAQRVLDLFALLLEQITQCQDIKLRDLQVVSPSDERRLMEWNGNLCSRLDTCIHHLIHQRRLEQAQAPAVCAWDGQLSYAELDDKSSRLSRYLRTKDVGPGEPVLLYFEKSLWTTVAMLSVLKAGGTFVLLDPSYPRTRLQQIARESKARVIVSSVENEVASRSLGSTAVVIGSGDSGDPIYNNDEATPDSCEAAANPNDAAYIAFTSGSTGKPKGVIITHAAFCTSAIAHGNAMSMDRNSRVLQFASYAFDISISDNLTTLILGGCVCVPSERQRKDHLALAARQMKVTWANLTPSTSRILCAEDLSTLKYLVLSGESMSKSDIEAWAAKVTLASSYGPAECSIKCIIRGKILPGSDPYNLGKSTGSACWIVQKNDVRKLAPIGCIGEILIEGPIVGRGYVNNVDQAGKAFMPSPAWLCRLRSDASRSLVYLTGDLAQYGADGSIRFIGRKDTQIKLRGQRIELLEVEHHVSECFAGVSGVTAEIISPKDCLQPVLAVFVAFGHPTGSDLDPTEESNDKLELLLSPNEHLRRTIQQAEAQLANLLPSYMIPSVFIPVNFLPLTKSGKTDRRRLRALASVLSPGNMAAYVGSPSEKRDPSTPVECQLRDVFSAVLNLPHQAISIDDSFFHLGGDSITAMQVSAMCRARRLQTTVPDIFRYKTVALLAPHLSQLSASAEKSTAEERDPDQPFCLSPIQQMFFQNAPNVRVRYNQSFFLRLTPSVNELELRTAIEQITNFHGMLRVRFRQDEAGNWVQAVTGDVRSSYAFNRTITKERKQVGASAMATQECIDVVRGPTFAAHLFDIDKDGQYLYLVAHHLVIDLVSWRVILSDLENLLRGGSISRQRSSSFRVWCQRAAEYSEEHLSPNESLPMEVAASEYDYWGMSDRANLHMDVETEQFVLDVSSSNALLGHCNQAYRTQPVEILHAALAHSFSLTFTDRCESVIFSEGHGRESFDPSIDISDTVGWFTTVWPLQIATSQSQDFVTTLRQVKDGRRCVPCNGWAYFSSRCLNSRGRSKFAQHFPVEVLFNYEGLYQQLERDGGLFQHASWRPENVSDVAENMGRFSLVEVNVTVVHSRLKFSFAFNRHLRHHARVKAWAERCQSVVKQAAQQLACLKPSFTLSDFPLLSLTYEQVAELTEHTLNELDLSPDNHIQEIYPCSPMQQGILISQARQPDLYQLRSTWEIHHTGGKEKIQLEALRATWHQIVQRHVILRTVFVDGVGSNSGGCLQIVLGSLSPATRLVEYAKEEEMALLQAGRSDFAAGQVQHEMIFVQTCTGKTYMIFSISHALIDGSSTWNILQELALAYEGKLSSKPSLPYSEYVSYLASRPTHVSLAYWKTHLSGLNPCMFPSLQDPYFAQNGKRRFHCSRIKLSQASKLDDFSRRHGITMANVFQVAWGLFLRLYTGADVVCFGYLLSGRDTPLPGIRSAVGPFINILPRQLHFASDGSLLQILRDCQNDFAQSLPHQHCLVSEIANVLGVAMPLFNTVLSFQHILNFGDTGQTSLSFRNTDRHEPVEFDLGLHVYLQDRAIDATFRFWDDLIPPESMQLIGTTFDRLLSAVIENPDGSVPAIQQYEFSKQNPIQQPEEASVSCVHDLIGTRCRQQPLRPAVYAWDGEFTYHKLDSLSSDLAHTLIAHGAAPEKFIPILLHKSKWTPVAILGVIKAGAAFLLLDPSYPVQRLRHMCEQVDAAIVVSSIALAATCRTLAGISLVLDDEKMAWRSCRQIQPLRQVHPTNVLYAVFTSGSTGTPKAVVTEHQAFATSALAHIPLMNLTPSTRALQFSSHAFDVSVSDYLFTLIAGGCVCIPSEEERMHDITSAITCLGANWAHLTPSILRLLPSPERTPTIKTLALIGESMSEKDITTWSEKVRLICTYGPAECSVVSTIHSSVLPTSHPRNIGYPVSASCWLVDPKNPDRLVPPGAIGELVIGGSILARGYWKDPEKTTAAFSEGAAWMQQLPSGSSGPVRLYRTGDLARYNPDGSLMYIGRKDTQVKIRGQRVELGEIENHILQLFAAAKAIVVDLVHQGCQENSLSVLACFVLLDKEKTSEDGGSLFEDSSPDFVSDVAHVESQLTELLPVHMLPSFYVPLAFMPLTKSGKTDRSRLRREAAKSYKDLVQESDPTAERSLASNANRAERMLLKLMARVLHLDINSVQLRSNFFQIGGDSIGAMQLCALARDDGMRISVADIFRHPTVLQLAPKLQRIHNAARSFEIPPFSLVAGKDNLQIIKDSAAKTCGIPHQMIEDIYPCTPFQEAMITLSDKQPGSYIHQSIYDVVGVNQLENLRCAWNTVANANAILRTRLAHVDGHGTFQVVLRGPVEWTVHASEETYLKDGSVRQMGLGEPLLRLGFIGRGEDEEPKRVAMTLHHAIYDAWSLPLILKQVELASRGELPSHQRFNAYIKYLCQTTLDDTRFWRTQFAGLQAEHFPRLPSLDYVAKPLVSMQRQIRLSHGVQSKYTLSTQIRLAWAIILSQYTGSDDVVYGITVSGRHAPVDDIENMIGPTTSVLPLRFSVQHDKSGDDNLKRLQDQFAATIPFEHWGLQQISTVSREAAEACRFHNMLVIQPQEAENRHSSLFRRVPLPNHGSTAFGSHPLILVCKANGTGVRIEAIYDEHVLEERQMDRILSQFSHILNQVHTELSGPLNRINLLSEEDAQQLKRWNGGAPKAHTKCIHDLILEKCMDRPGALAILAWDGELTYGEVNDLSSRLAARLIMAGVMPQTLVPLYFEKSKWVPVAMLAVLKVGAAFVLLDHSHPTHRLLHIYHDIDAKFVISSASLSSKARELSNSVIAFGDDDVRSWDTTSYSLPKVEPCDLAYVQFTSGTTDRPKGVLIEHEAYCSSAKAHVEAFSLNHGSRVLQFASYSFDANLIENLSTLLAGGCICIPSENERYDNISAAIRRFKVNWLHLTPVVARLIHPRDVPTVKTLVLVGDKMSNTNITTWTPYVSLMCGYGPTECSVCSTVQTSIQLGADPHVIGKATGGVCWVVDKNNHNRLAAVGSIGELLIEGPSVARGYLNQPEKTKEAFLEKADWLPYFRPHRQSKLYKTGDLVQYDASGSIRFVGRKDSQVKVRGQRIETGEVEAYLVKFFPSASDVVVEAISPLAEDSGPDLVAFVWVNEPSDEKIERPNVDQESVTLASPVKLEFQQAALAAETHLRQFLPINMVPTAFVPLNYMPLTSSGKQDRRALRRSASSWSLEVWRSYRAPEAETRQASTEEEHLIQSLSAQVLGLERSVTNLNDSFFRLGGDSIKAMKLVAMARTAGKKLTVADVFRHPTLADLATDLLGNLDAEDDHLPAFDMLSKGTMRSAVTQSALEQCQVGLVQLQDIYPCTPLQEGLMALSLKRPGMYVARFVFQLPDWVDIGRFQDSWEATVEANPILRTRIVHDHVHGSFQVVVCEKIHWQRADTVVDDRLKVEFGGKLSCFSILGGESTRSAQFILHLHHALYDGWSLPMIMAQVEEAYNGATLSRRNFNTFIKYISQRNIDPRVEQFWQSKFTNLQAEIFPAVPQLKHQSSANISQEHYIPLLRPTSPDFTLSSVVRFAWAAMLSQYTNSTDVVFGISVMGRNAPLRGIETTTGPTFATIPERVQIQPDQTVKEMLRTVQEQSIAAIEFEQTGLQQIQRFGKDCERACAFGNMLVIQASSPPGKGPESSIFADGSNEAHTEGAFDAYALTALCTLNEDSIQIDLRFDDRALSAMQAQGILHQFTHILQQMCRDPEQRYEKIATPSPETFQQLRDWNEAAPAKVNACVHGLIEERFHCQASTQAVAAWDGDFSYRQIDELSSKLATHLVDLGVGPEKFVPLCFEKSKWVVVGIMGVLRAGAAFILLDPDQPVKRLKDIVGQTDSNVVLASETHSTLASNLLESVVVISDSDDQWKSNHKVHGNFGKPENAAYAVFTSGTTGIPKGVVIEHASYCTAAKALQEALCISDRSRVLQFASFSFDVSISDILTTLIAGGCICFPSEQSRLNNTIQAINEMDVNWAHLTPSVIKLLSPDSIPKVNRIILSGEIMSAQDLSQWVNRVHLVNAYGPAECSVDCAVQSHLTPHCDVNDMGTSVGGVCWIVSPQNHNHLLPIGATGELIVEGAIVGRGYLENPARTAEVFIQDPVWLQHFRHDEGTRFYKTGDLVQYAAGGSMRYMGRKDTQTKLHGQRIELGDIEENIRSCLAEVGNVVVEKWAPNDDREQECLTAFIQYNDLSAAGGQGCNTTSSSQLLLPLTEASRDYASRLRSRLQAVLPRIMIPTFFLPVRSIPLTASGKTDRRLLTEATTSLPLEAREAYAARLQQAKLVPTTEVERKIQMLVARMLGIKPDDIGMADSFLTLGGTSITAMKLVGLARREGLLLSVADVFRCLTLSDLSATVALEARNSIDQPTIEPFSLLLDKAATAEILRVAVSQCHVPEYGIQDMYPCTPLQEGLMSLTARDPNAYIMSLSYQVRQDVDTERLCKAWDMVLDANVILRTQIIHSDVWGSFQVVVRRSTRPALTGETDAAPMGLGKPLVQATIREQERPSERRCFVLKIHHAIYDGWSLPLLLKQLTSAYHHHVLPMSSMTPFISYIQQQRQDSMDFWRSSLANFAEARFPTPSRQDYRPRPSAIFRHSSDTGSIHPRRRYTLSTRLRLAWAMVLCAYSGSRDVVCGTAVTGRAAPVVGIEQMTGPTVATVPFRFRFEEGESVAESLQRIQNDSTAAVPFEQLGLQNISRLGACEATACDFQSFLVIQPAQQDECLPPMFSECQKSSAEAAFHSYALTVECQETMHSVDIIATFDPAVIQESQLRRMIYLFENILHVTNDEALPMSKVPSISPQDECQLAQWNGNLPEPVDCCVQNLINLNCNMNPDAMAVHSWDGSLTYHELGVQSSNLASVLIEFGVGPEVFVPVYSDKSFWVVVGILAIMKAGGAFVLLDTSYPLPRLREICQRIQAEVILVSAQSFEDALELAPHRIALGQDGSLGSCDGSERQDQKGEIHGKTNSLGMVTKTTLQPHNAVYAVFTSGTTGTAKGAVITHRAFSTSSKALAKAFKLDGLARVFQFSSYAFDVSIADMLVTLVSGACICIPSNAQRERDMIETINEFNANWMHLTPSVARLLSPDQIPSVKTVVLSGEAMTATEISTWAKHVTLINAYGPAECSVDCCVRPSIQPASSVTNAADIGFATGCALWVVDPNNHERLMPVGAEGELVVEGPIVGREYVGDVESTAAAFMESPLWQVQLGRPVASPLYKTGDMVRYNVETGSLQFLRRKDNQVKLRGQRLELGEVEHHLELAYPEARDVLAELVTFGDSVQPAALVAFIVQRSGYETPPKLTESLLLHPTDKFRSEVRAAASRLRQSVPTYMIPTIVLAIAWKPLTTNGKSDRKRLRETVAGLTQEQMAAYTGLPAEKVMPSNAKETSLHSMLAEILGRPSSDIGMDDNFFHLGADSITAIKLAGVLRRKAGLLMSVADVFREPTLRGIASALTGAADTRATSSTRHEQNYSLLALDDIPSFLINTLAPTLPFPIEDVVDVLPATHFQDTCIRERSLTYFLIEIRGPVDRHQVQNACQGLIEKHAILRTIFLQYQPPQIVQVVLRQIPVTFNVHEAKEHEDTSDLCSTLCAQGLSDRVQFGRSPIEFTLLESPGSPSQSLIFKISHAQYDGISMAFLYEDLLALLCGSTTGAVTDYGSHVYQRYECKNTVALTWWRETLRGSSMTFLQEPNLVRDLSQSLVPVTVGKVITTPSVPVGITLASLVKAAWACTLVLHTGSSDVVFGQLVNGRSAINSRVVGPCINTIPARVMFQGSWTALDLLTHVQNQHAHSLQYETTDFDEIVENSTEWERGIQLGSVVQHQNIDEYPTLTQGNLGLSTSAIYEPPPPTNVMVMSRPGQDGLRLDIAAPGEWMSEDHVKIVHQTFCGMIERLAERPYAMLNDLRQDG